MANMIGEMNREIRIPLRLFLLLLIVAAIAGFLIARSCGAF